ncbi:MAG: hypothetical protein J6X62_00735 [Bacteroidales bacterium]|nr:hypothetical protein [Bacteroidales bacterium]
MKSVLIVYNQANNERMEYMLDTLGIRGFTFWENVQGRGSGDFGRDNDGHTSDTATRTPGDPHRGTHTWPELNNAILTVIDDDKVDELLLSIRKLDRRNEEVGIRAFVWNIEKIV